MKDGIKKIIKFSFLFFIIFSLTGCGGQEEQIVVENKEKVGDVKNIKIVNSKRIEDNSIVFMLKNKDNYPINDVVVTIEFWKKGVIEEENEESLGDKDIEDEETKEENKEPKDKLITSGTQTFTRIVSKQSVAGMVSPGTREYDYYKIFIDIVNDTKTAQKINELDSFEIEDNTVLTLPAMCTETVLENCVTEDKMPTISDELKLTVKNRSKNKISYYEIAVIFYKGNTIVGYSDNNGTNIDSKKMRDIGIMFPKNFLTKQNIEFDNYTIYRNLAYSRQ